MAKKITYDPQVITDVLDKVYSLDGTELAKLASMLTGDLYTFIGEKKYLPTGEIFEAFEITPKE